MGREPEEELRFYTITTKMPQQNSRESGNAEFAHVHCVHCTRTKRESAKGQKGQNAIGERK